MFRILKRNRIDFNLDSIRAWLISEINWKPKYVDKLIQVANKIKENRTIRGCNRKYWADDIFEQWKNKVEN